MNKSKPKEALFNEEQYRFLLEGLCEQAKALRGALAELVPELEGRTNTATFCSKAISPSFQLIRPAGSLEEEFWRYQALPMDVEQRIGMRTASSDECYLIAVASQLLAGLGDSFWGIFRLAHSEANGKNLRLRQTDDNELCFFFETHQAGIDFPSVDIGEFCKRVEF